MPASETPGNRNEPNGPNGTRPETGNPGPEGVSADNPSLPEADGASPVVKGSRWVDYDTHELLSMISELEDERRWARFREGIWLAILFHLALLSALTWIPKYVFKVPQLIDPIDAIQQRKDLTYLDLPPDALRNIRPKEIVKPLPEKATQIDKKTLEEMKRDNPPAPAPPPPQQAPAPALQQPSQPIPPTTQSQVEAPRPAAVPARPNFAMESQDPAEQLRQAMRGAAHNRGTGNVGDLGSSRLSQHPGAGSGGLQVLSDTQGVDFSNWLQRWHHETERTWDPLIPDEVNPPIDKSGMVAIRFKVLPNGRLMDGSLVLEGRSGDTALDRAAWGALTGSNYPPLPHDFHGPYLELRAFFLYNMQPPQ
jgi:hypothetical protein